MRLLPFLAFLTCSQPAYIDIVVHDGTSHTLSVQLGESVRVTVDSFVAAHRLENGAGCRNDAACVSRKLANSLEMMLLKGLDPSWSHYDDSAPLFSGLGWHREGTHAAEITPVKDATLRSRARTNRTKIDLQGHSLRAKSVLSTLRAEALSGRCPADVRCEANFDIIEPYSSVSSVEAVLAIGVMSAPSNLAHRQAIRLVSVDILKIIVLPVTNQMLVRIDLNQSCFNEFITFCRNTWLHPGVVKSLGIKSRFFVGLPLTKLSEESELVAQEALAFKDVALMDLEDHYMSTPIKVSRHNTYLKFSLN